MNIKMISVIIGMLALAGCEETPPPVPEPQYDLNDPIQRCQYLGKGLGNPWLNQYQAQVMMEQMRSLGCMG